MFIVTTYIYIFRIVNVSLKKFFFRKLEENWRDIRREGIELLNSKGVNLFKEEAENLKDTGDWRQLDLYFRGKCVINFVPSLVLEVFIVSRY